MLCFIKKRMTSDFEIKLIKPHWIKDDGNDDPDDLCIHGEVLVRIGDETISDKDSGAWSIGVTALYLMRTISNGYTPEEFGNYLLPCCGHFMIPDDSGENYVVIQGCNIGIEWKIDTHQDSIKWTSEKGTIGTMHISEYKLMILKLVKQIEEFYSISESKKIPNDEFDQSAWKQFWNEWNELKLTIEN